MEGKCFFCLFLVFHSASERWRKELGTVGLLLSKGEGGGGIQKSVVYENFTPLPPQKMLYMKILHPPWQ